MYNKLKFILIFILVSSSISAAKYNGIISGRVAEKDGNLPLSFATVIVHDNNSNIIGGATSDDSGKFAIDKLHYGHLSVKISFIGFNDTTLNVLIDESNHNINLGDITLSANTTSLNSAVVTAKIPMIEQKMDKIVMNVSEAVFTQGGNALDVIRKAPGVSVDPNGNILLNGNPVQIFIDDRPSNMNGEQLAIFLEGTDGTSIDKVEIMAHPSSKYDASGSGGIINIKTKKNFIKGVNGQVKGTYGASPYFGTNYNSLNGNALLNYRSDRISSTLNYSPRYNEEFYILSSMSDYGGGYILDGKNKTDEILNSHNLRLSTDLFINKKSIVGFIFGGYIRNSDAMNENGNSGNTLYRDGLAIEKTITTIDNTDNYRNIYTNINFSHKFNENKELTLNADWGKYEINKYTMQDNLFTDINGVYSREPIIFRSNSNQDIDILSTRADWEQISFDKYMLEGGVKWARSFTDNNLFREDKVNNHWQPNKNLSSIFGYTEHIAASYLSVAGQFGSKWSIKAGIRGEYTNATGNWISSDTVTNKQYINLFPTLFVGFNHNQDFRLGLSYTKRIKRPQFDQLNPFRYYIDAYSYAEGNPNLLPQYTNSISLTAGIKQHYSIMLFAQLTNGLLMQNIYLDSDTGEKLIVWQNFGKQSFLGGALSITEFPVTNWLIFNGNINIFNIKNSTAGYMSSSIYSTGNINTTLILPKNLKVELTGFLQSGLHYGYLKILPQGGINVGVKKGVLNNRGYITLNINDLFDTIKNKIVLNSDQFKAYNYEEKHKSREITISFQYSFGQSRSTKLRKVGNIEEASRTGVGN